MKWYAFDAGRGSNQKRPDLRKLVLVKTVIGDLIYDGCSTTFVPTPGLPLCMAVGYRKDGAGDKQSPYFVVPGVGGKVVAWCDCLPPDLTLTDEGNCRLCGEVQSRQRSNCVKCKCPLPVE